MAPSDKLRNGSFSAACIVGLSGWLCTHDGQTPVEDVKEHEAATTTSHISIICLLSRCIISILCLAKQQGTFIPSVYSSTTRGKQLEAMTVLFWPNSKQEKESKSMGIIIGWKYDSNTFICAKILHHNDSTFLKNILAPSRYSDDLRILGKWVPAKQNVDSWLRSDDLDVLSPTPLGPWWVNKPRDSNDLLVYYDPKQNYNFTLEMSYQTGFFSLLKRLRKIEQIHRLQHDCKPEKQKEKSNDEPSFLVKPLAKKCIILQNSLLFKHLSRPNRIPMCYIFSKNGTSELTSVRWHFSIYLDVFLGALLGIVILIYCQSLSAALSVAVHVQHVILRDAIKWLESFPIGFKLNVPLTHSMGQQLHIVFDYWHDALLRLGDFLGYNNAGFWWMLTGFSSISFLFGFTTLLALLVDLIQLGTLHLTFLQAFFSELYRFELYMLDNLWKVYQGKKYNPLRKRTDTMEYDSMQLLIGMLLFAFILFLFTTILVYHAFYTLLFVAVQPVGLWLLYGFLRDFPFDELWKRWRDPLSMGAGVYFDKEVAHVTHIRVIPKSYKSLLAPFTGRYLKCSLFILWHILQGLATGKRLNIVHSCLQDQE